MEGMSRRWLAPLRKGGTRYSVTHHGGLEKGPASGWSNCSMLQLKGVLATKQRSANARVEEHAVADAFNMLQGSQLGHRMRCAIHQKGGDSTQRGRHVNGQDG